MRLLLLRLLLILPSLLVFAPALHAQRARWEPPGGSLALRQTSQLSLIFEDCEPTGEFQLPEIAGVTLGAANRGEQTSFNIINGEASRSKTVYFTYPVRPTERSTVRIPSFTVQTDKGAVRVPAAAYEVGEATVGNSSVPLETAANSRVNVGAGQIWAGEVVNVDYVLSVANRFPANLGSNPEWTPAPLVIEDWSNPEPGTALVNGETRNTVSYRTRGYVRQPGTHTLAPVSQLVNLRVPSSGFSIFQAFQAEQYTITSNPPQLVVRPLPTPAPAGFNGAVGNFKLTSKVVPENATVGEPITWTLELTGTGNWPDLPGLPARDVSRDFRVVQPQARRTPVEGKLFDASLAEDVVLIPTRPGTYRLGPIVWSYFDPKTGRYETITTEPTTVTIAAGTAPAPTPSSSTVTPAPTAPTGDSAAPVVRSTPAPLAPSGIPRDPLPLGGAVAAPWRTATVVWTSVAIIAILPLAWLGLAWRRAIMRDPAAPARRARERLRRTLRELRATSTADAQRALLHRWQRDATILWSLRRVVPAATSFRPDDGWAQLWAESERALYSADPSLPADWITRAEQALSRRPAKRFRPWSVFRPSNLVPLVVLGVLFAAAITATAQPARDAYTRGEFRAAEKQWREALAAQPTNWSAHHNLALALAQQQRWAEAAAHALTAFVQQPSQESVRWHFEYTLGRAGYSPPVLGEFTAPDLRHRLAWLFSPSEWQRVLLAAVALAVMAGLLMLMQAYGPRRRGLTLIAALAGVLAFVLAAAAAVSLPRYGPARDPRGVLVWKAVPLRSLPTDVATEQQTTNLAAGSLAIVDQSFLGWRRLVFPNGQTGWVRKEDFVPLWAVN